MSDLNELVTVFNRSSEVLQGTWDGKHYDLVPGEQPRQFTRLQASAFRFQNPQKGHGTPFEDWSSKSVYLISIVEDGDPMESLEQSDAPQRWDTYLVNGPNTEVIRPRGGAGQPEVRQPQQTMRDSGFVKP